LIRVRWTASELASNGSRHPLGKVALNRPLVVLANPRRDT
jgi:hypothetical protein